MTSDVTHTHAARVTSHGRNLCDVFRVLDVTGGKESDVKSGHELLDVIDGRKLSLTVGNDLHVLG